MPGKPNLSWFCKSRSIEHIVSSLHHQIKQLIAWLCLMCTYQQLAIQTYVPQMLGSAAVNVFVWDCVCTHAFVSLV